MKNQLAGGVAFIKDKRLHLVQRWRNKRWRNSGSQLWKFHGEFCEIWNSPVPQKTSFSGVDLLDIKYGFPGSVLPQRIRINFRSLWNDVFSKFSQTLQKSSFSDWTFWTPNMVFPGRFYPRGFVLISLCSETLFFQGLKDLPKISF